MSARGWGLALGPLLLLACGPKAQPVNAVPALCVPPLSPEQLARCYPPRPSGPTTPAGRDLRWPRPWDE